MDCFTSPTSRRSRMRHAPSSPACERRSRTGATSRECIKESKIGDVRVTPGDKSHMATFLAGRVPRVFPRPEEVILDRRARHVSFGYGPHLCIGMHLARREMRIALEEMLSGLPEFSLKP